MPFPWIPVAMVAGSALGGRLFKGKTPEAMPFGDFYREFLRTRGRSRYGLTPEQYQAAATGGAETIVGERQRAERLGSEQLRGAGLQRSTSQAGLSLRAASTSERSFAKLMNQLAALDAQVAEQQQQTETNQAIQAYQAQSLEQARVAQQAEAQTAQIGQLIQQFVDPIENFYLLRDLRNIRALSAQPSAFFNAAPRTDYLFDTRDALGDFDLQLTGGQF